MRCITIALLLINFAAYSQNSIRGKVVHETSGEAIANASVFVNGSTIGTLSKADGTFELGSVPAGNHELVISSIGYATLVWPYTASDLPLNLIVKMQPKAAELATIVVEPDEKDGWKRWGKFFVDNFIGTTSFAEDCKLKNPEVLRFRYSKKNHVLRVIADEPLIIENKALGYNIKYQLEEFSFDYNNKFLVYLGYAFFEDINTKRNGLKKRWEANRATAWNGSIQHFMRSLYFNTLAEEGFEVRRLIKIPDPEKGKGKMKDIILPALLTADSVVVMAGADKMLFFLDYLYVTYKKEREEKEYIAYSFERRDPYYQRSTVFLPDLVSLIIDSKGNYSPVQEFVSYGYWAWSEKIANMLPLDYGE